MKPKLFTAILLSILATTIVGIVAGFNWQNSDLSNRADTLRIKLGDLEIRDERIDQLTKLQSEYRSHIGLSALIDSALPKGKRQSELVLQLKQLVTSAGMSFPGVTFPTTEKPGPTSQTVPSGAGVAIPITMALSGSYSQLQNFLQSLERFSRTINVTSITIDRTKDKLNFSITLTVQVIP